MKMEPIITQSAIVGHIKWFDINRDFGFVVPMDGGPDILLHGNTLREFGQGSARTGSRVEVSIRRGIQGLQVAEVLDLATPETEDTDEAADFEELLEADLDAIPLSPARIKWYNVSKGYGFAQVFGDPEDIFVHSRVLQNAGLQTLNPGEAVGLRCGEGARGRIALQLLSWPQVQH